MNTMNSASRIAPSLRLDFHSIFMNAFFSNSARVLVHWNATGNDIMLGTGQTSCFVSMSDVRCSLKAEWTFRCKLGHSILDVFCICIKHL